ncbi:hypothetical protein D9619_005760 [Psilocybe cf. subviscida]|uniref:Uncharacterized protein n=1 Tax=Psilocybe cf. subviscida TaxID=2480587 RepID=A0A8H5BZ86_9AGAR|nr:hypothetical protein D9619_005760 [Psilocybe cf. subviscida]
MQTPAAFYHYQSSSPGAPFSSRCADSGLYRSPADALGSWCLVLPPSRTLARALVHVSPGSTIAPTLAMMYHCAHRV